MEIVNDHRKNSINIAAHGYDMDALTEEFFAGSVVVNAKQGRFMAIGEFGGKIVVVIFTRLGSEGISTISMRRADRKEREIYAKT